MNKKDYQKIGGWFAFALFLLACAIPSLTVSSPTQGSEPQSMDVLGTAIVQTAAAAQTQTATAQPSPTFTLTPSVTPTPPTPTPTFFFSLFTSTPIVPLETTDPAFSVEGGNPAIGLGSSGDPIPYSGKPWTCIGIGKSPPSGALIEAGKSFTAYWTVINTGTKIWTSTTVDFVYRSGYRHEGRVIQDLSSAVAPGRNLTVKVSFTAPKNAGEYTAIWTLKVGNYPFCAMKITFEVPE